MLPLLVLELGFVPLIKGVEFIDFDPELEPRDDLGLELFEFAEGRMVLGD